MMAKQATTSAPVPLADLHVSAERRLAKVSQRKTRTGETWRSAMAPKISGDMKEATAAVANASDKVKQPRGR